MCGNVERVEVDVQRAPVVVSKLRDRNRKGGTQLDQGQHATLQRGHSLAECFRHGFRASQVGGRMLPAARPGEVDQLAGSQRGREAFLGLGVEQLPA